MIWQIVRKEILENLLSLRFTLSLLLIICLFAASGFIFIGKYRQQSNNYWNQTNKNLSVLKDHAQHLESVAQHKQVILRKPKVLTLCVEGFERSLPNWFRVNPYSIDFPEVKNQTNLLYPYFSNIDWGFVISLIISFIALILSYDTICGEKETGTLRQMLAGSTVRHSILLGKYFGIMFVLSMSLLIGLLVNLIIVNTSDVIVIMNQDWLKIIAIIFLSLLYLSIFVLLGIFVSSRTHYSISSMVILLFVWVGLVILIPSLSRIITYKLHKIPSREELDRSLIDCTEQFERDAYAGKFGERSRFYGMDPVKSKAPWRAKWVSAMTVSKNNIMEKHLNAMIAQANAGRNDTCISPAVIYQRACEAIAGTGINRFTSLHQQIKGYQTELKEYVRSKDSEDPKSLHLLFEYLGNFEVDWNAISKKPVDFDSVPKFQERDMALGESLQLAIWDIGLLVLFNLVFFAAAFVSFLKYDVR